MRNTLLYLFIIPFAAAFLPYLASDFFASPYQHGFFSIDIFILLVALLSVRKNIILTALWIFVLFLYSFFYENNLDLIKIAFQKEELATFFCFGYFLLLYISTNLFSFSKKIKTIVFSIFTFSVIITDWLNIFYYTYSLSPRDLWNLANHFLWSTLLFFCLPIFHFALIYFFSRKILTVPKLDTKKSYFLLSIFITVLLLNNGICYLQHREVFLSSTIKTFFSKYDKNVIGASSDVTLSPQMEKTFQTKHFYLSSPDTNYTSVVMVLVESWGVPKNIDLLKYSFSFFDDVPQSFKGLYLRNVAYTQGAEWEDFNMPQGKASDFTLPKLYQNAHYETWYLHGYDGDFYERKTNYPALGFDSLLFRTELFKRGLKSCKYGYPGICDTSTAAFIAEILSDSSKKHFIYWTTLDAHYPYSLSPGEKESAFCKDFNLNEAECAYYSRQSVSLKTVASLAKKFPRTKFIVRGDHRPMGANTPGFVSSFYHRWVPMLILN